MYIRGGERHYTSLITAVVCFYSKVNTFNQHFKFKVSRVFYQQSIDVAVVAIRDVFL